MQCALFGNRANVKVVEKTGQVQQGGEGDTFGDRGDGASSCSVPQEGGQHDHQRGQVHQRDDPDDCNGDGDFPNTQFKQKLNWTKILWILDTAFDIKTYMFQWDSLSKNLAKILSMSGDQLKLEEAGGESMLFQVVQLF